MDEKRTFVVHVNLDWRILMAIAIIAASLIVVYGRAGAQPATPASINDPALQPTPATSEPSEAGEPALPEAPAGQEGDLRLTINGDWIPADAVGGAPATARAVGADSATVGGGRHVYLTATNYDTDEALTACGPGYHMASLWEILDVSNLVYDREHPDAFVRDDSGEGPPSNWYGWIRTGYVSSGSTTAGQGNCRAWTSTSNADEGTAVRLAAAWETPPGEIATWDANAFACNLPAPVWCVGDFHALYLPIVTRNHS